MEVSFYLTRANLGKQTANEAKPAKGAIKPKKTSNLTSIYAHIRYSGHRFKYYLTEKIDPQFWNLEEQRAKKTNRFPGYMELNRRLGKIYEKIKDIHSAYRNDHDNHEPSPDVLRALIDRELKEGAKKGQKTFMDFYQEIVNNSANGTRVQYSTGKPFSKNTVKAYNTALNHLKAFQTKTKKKVDFDNITLEFYADYTEYLIKTNKLSSNSIGKDIKNIKAILNEATERGLNTNFQFRSRKFSVTKEESMAIYLNEKELIALANLKLEDSERMERVRDLFLIGCYTGLRYGDYSSLRPEQIKDGFIEITQAKTSHNVVIPVHPIVKGLLQKYSSKLPRAISNQKTNEYLKEIGQKLPAMDEHGQPLPTLNETITKIITKGGVKVTRTLKKWELLTTHTARRSFATNEYLAGTPSITIMAITGHKTEKSFLKYIKLSPTEHAQKMKDIWASRNQLKAV